MWRRAIQTSRRKKLNQKSLFLDIWAVKDWQIRSYCCDVNIMIYDGTLFSQIVSLMRHDTLPYIQPTSKHSPTTTPLYPEGWGKILIQNIINGFRLKISLVSSVFTYYHKDPPGFQNRICWGRVCLKINCPGWFSTNMMNFWHKSVNDFGITFRFLYRCLLPAHLTTKKSIISSRLDHGTIHNFIFPANLACTLSKAGRRCFRHPECVFSSRQVLYAVSLMLYLVHTALTAPVYSYRWITEAIIPLKKSL